MSSVCITGSCIFIYDTKNSDSSVSISEAQLMIPTNNNINTLNANNNIINNNNTNSNEIANNNNSVSLSLSILDVSFCGEERRDSSILLIGGSLYLFGGYTSHSISHGIKDYHKTSITYPNTLLSFDVIDRFPWCNVFDIFESNIQYEKPLNVNRTFPVGRIGHSLVHLFFDTIFLFGGFDGKYRYNDLHYCRLFCESGPHWFCISHGSFHNTLNNFNELKKSVKNIPSPRYYHCSFTHDNMIYIFGGWNGRSTLNDLWVFRELVSDNNNCKDNNNYINNFNFNNFGWCPVPYSTDGFDDSFIRGRCKHQCTVHGNLVAISGGYYGNSKEIKDKVDIGNIIIYDIRSRRFESLILSFEIMIPQGLGWCETEIVDIQNTNVKAIEIINCCNSYSLFIVVTEKIINKNKNKNPITSHIFLFSYIELSIFQENDKINCKNAMGSHNNNEDIHLNLNSKFPIEENLEDEPKEELKENNLTIEKNTKQTKMITEIKTIYEDIGYCLQNHHVHVYDYYLYIIINENKNKNKKEQSMNMNMKCLRISVDEIKKIKEIKEKDVNIIINKNPLINQFEVLQIVNAPKSRKTSASILRDRSIFFFGGIVDKQIVSDFFSFEISTKQFVDIPLFRKNEEEMENNYNYNLRKRERESERESHCMCYSSSIDKIFVYGGRNDKCILSDLLIIDPKNGSYEVLENNKNSIIENRNKKESVSFSSIHDTWPPPLIGASLVAHENKDNSSVYLFGGWDGENIRDELFEFCPLTRKWTLINFRNKGTFGSVNLYRNSTIFMKPNLLVVTGGTSPLGSRNGDLLIFDILKRIWSRYHVPHSSSQVKISRSFHLNVWGRHLGLADKDFLIIGGADGQRRDDVLLLSLPMEIQTVTSKRKHVTMPPTLVIQSDNTDLLKSRILELEERISQLGDAALCCVCYAKTADCLLRPCSHLNTCISCTAKLSECPLCRVLIDDTIHVFIL